VIKLILYPLLFSSLLSYSQKTKVDSIKNLLKKNQPDSLLARRFNDLAWAYVYSNSDSMLHYSILGRKLSKQIGNQNIEAISLAHLGSCYSLKNEYVKGIAYIDSSLEICRNIKLEDWEAINSLNKGMLYYFLGEFQKALECNKVALNLHGKHQDKGGMASANLMLGIICMEMKNTKDAIHYHEYALAIYRDLKEQENEAAVLNNLGTIYAQRGMIQEALNTYKQALKINEATGNKMWQISNLNNIGLIYADSSLKKYNTALQYHTQALALSKSVSDSVGIAISLGNIGSSGLRLGKTKESLEALNESVRLAFRIKDKRILQQNLFVLSEAYLEGKDYHNAHKYLKKFYLIKDSILGEETTRQLNEFQTKYQSEKKDKELLIKDSEILRQKAETVRQSAQRNYFITGFLATFVLAVVTLRGYTNKRKANKIIQAQKSEVEIQRDLIHEQKKLVDEHQKDILDSIHYAKRIQSTLMANQHYVDQYLPENFIIFRPKDIVSGDFYWAAEHSGKFYVAACDSTGHGVPGAFMSLLNMGFLSEAIKEKDILSPDEAFNYVRSRLIAGVSKEGQKDGMDGILICLDINQITYAAANNGPVIIRNGQILEQPADKMPVGKHEKELPFTGFTMDVQKNDMVYLFTDGFADQFGGPKGKKFKYKPLIELLATVSKLPMEEQKKSLEEAFENWKANLEQVDDVCVIGFRII